MSNEKDVEQKQEATNQVDAKQESSSEAGEKQEAFGMPSPKVIAIIMTILLPFVIYFTVQSMNGKKEKEVIVNNIAEIAEAHPEIGLPMDFDLSQRKKWDSGIAEYRISSAEVEYTAHVDNGEIIAIYSKKPRIQLYPIQAKDDSASVDKKKDDTAQIVVPSINSLPEPKVSTGEPMTKIEYTFTVFSLLNDAVINVKDVQSIVETPEIIVNPNTMESATTLLNESIDMFNEAVAIVPPKDWEKLHQTILNKWHEHIVGEHGLVASMEQAWLASEDEREKALEAVKEKSKVVGEYSLEFLDLLLDFLAEIVSVKSDK